VGSGMESHALHGDGIYYATKDKLWVNLYVSSTAESAAMGEKLTMDTDLPEGESAKLTLTLDTPKEFTLALRRPYWVGDGFSVRVNDEAVPQDQPVRSVPVRASQETPDGVTTNVRGRATFQPPACGSYVEITRTWKSGDIVELTLPKTLRLEPLPDNPRRVAILWGPLVLAGNLGPEAERGHGRGARAEPPKVPVF
ncbi:MAG: glycoside hydrolase family 127 protein, partial [Planctomycetes bacterium]|nr:glycoside hydrolase family 127 protein [Planctomycetota bacterium]